MVSTGLNIAFGVFTCLSLGCGITYSVLIADVIKAIFHKFGVSTGTGAGAAVTTELWMIGLAYIIPGFIGVLACIVRRRGLYVAHMVLSLLAIGILFSLFFLGTVTSGVHSQGTHFCEMVDGVCQCETEGLKTLLQYDFTCREINRLVRMGIATGAMFWGGGVITLIAAILSGSIIKSLKPTPETIPGTGMNYLPTATQQHFSSNPYKRFDQ